MVSTNYTKPSTNLTGFGIGSTSTDIILLQTGDSLLLQDGSTNILIESSVSSLANFAPVSIQSTGYSRDLINILLLETGYKMLLQDGEFLFLEEVPGKKLDYTKPSTNPTNYSKP
ncbi:MAG TPA: hypothetical protein ENI23_03735 [bacterium]|nr:hypothetical protein [bacterium]